MVEIKNAIASFNKKYGGITEEIYGSMKLNVANIRWSEGVPMRQRFEAFVKTKCEVSFIYGGRRWALYKRKNDWTIFLVSHGLRGSTDVPFETCLERLRKFYLQPDVEDKISLYIHTVFFEEHEMIV